MPDLVLCFSLVVAKVRLRMLPRSAGFYKAVLPEKGWGLGSGIVISSPCWIGCDGSGGPDESLGCLGGSF